jgi:hypothetical protein
LKLARLIFADIYRDGGSYKASFETDGGLTYNVFLQRSKMPDSAGLHHRWLFQHFGEELPEGCLPVVTGSKEETALLGLLRDFMASRTLEAVSTTAPQENEGTHRLTELVYYIERREPCFLPILPEEVLANTALSLPARGRRL